MVHHPFSHTRNLGPSDPIFTDFITDRDTSDYKRDFLPLKVRMTLSHNKWVTPEDPGVVSRTGRRRRIQKWSPSLCLSLSRAHVLAWPSGVLGVFLVDPLVEETSI